MSLALSFFLSCSPFFFLLSSPLLYSLQFPLTALREIQILKALRHPNVLCVKEIVHSAASDFNRQRGSIYIVMEYLDHDLGGLLNQGVEFTAPEVKCLAKQLLTGLWFIHQAGFIHRDMKVANLLLSKDGVLKIADFGLARKIFKKDQKDAKYTSVVCTVIIDSSFRGGGYNHTHTPRMSLCVDAVPHPPSLNALCVPPYSCAAVVPPARVIARRAAVLHRNRHVGRGLHRGGTVYRQAHSSGWCCGCQR
eukprot:m.200866 g.200866  ORF g.200866 m.200866 type:complete len:250 (+) comp18409_c0_seq14:952-1701(+)